MVESLIESRSIPQNEVGDAQGHRSGLALLAEDQNAPFLKYPSIFLLNVLPEKF